jgi:hypothetical protein
MTWLAVALAALAGCAAGAAAPSPRMQAPAPAAPPASAEPGALLLSLERTPCEGTCPAYRIDVGVDGTVRYDGHFCVHTLGRAAGYVSPEKIEALRAAITRANFSNLARRCCVCDWDDDPTINITVADPPPARSVENACGFTGPAATVRDLADAIDTIVNTAQWTTGAAAPSHCVVDR